MFLLKQLIGAGFTVSSGSGGSDGSPADSDTYGSLVISHNPIGYWRLSESSGTVAADSSSNSPEHPGTYYNTPTLGQTGIVSNTYTSNTSVLFEQANQEYVETATFSGVTSLLPCTIECFVKTSGASDANAGIFFYRSGSNSASGLNIIASNLGKLGYHWRDVGGTYGYSGGPTLSDNIWYYVALVIESDKATFYAIDEGGSVTAAVNTTSHSALNISNDGWYIGRDPLSSGRSFQGYLDEVAIYDTALNRAKIESHALTAFGRYPSTTNLIFHVDASSVASYDSTQSPQPTTWTDLSGSGNDLDLTGTAGPPLYEDTSGIESLEFEEGQQEHGIFTGSPENIPDIGGNEVTFNVWWKAESTPNSSIIFLSSSTSSTSGQYRELNVHLPWSSIVYFDCGTDNSTFDRISKSSSGVTVTDWHMWTFTKNASTGSMKIYLDGAEWHSDTGKTKAITTPVAGSIGRRVVGSTSDYQVDGRSGEIQLYNSELSAATILSNYNATKSKYTDYSQYITGTATTPDSASNSVTGNLDIRMKISFADWTPASGNNIIARKRVASGYQKSWYLYLLTGTTTRLRAQISDDGSSEDTPFLTLDGSGLADSTVKWLRWVIEANGSTQILRVYEYQDANNDDPNGSWIEVANSSHTKTSIYDSTSDVVIGEDCNMYYFEMRDGIDGNIVAQFNASDVDGSSAPNVSGETAWTIS